MARETPRWVGGMSDMKVLAILVALAMTTCAQADVTISKKPTQNMSCVAGVCRRQQPMPC